MTYRFVGSQFYPRQGVAVTFRATPAAAAPSASSAGRSTGTCFSSATAAAKIERAGGTVTELS